MSPRLWPRATDSEPVNPLAIGTFCECGTRLTVGDNVDPGKTARACPCCGRGA